MKNFFHQLNIEMRIAYYLIKSNVLNEMELRSAFIIQTIGMFLNDFAFVIVWIFFFRTFGSINRWSVNETIALQGFVAFVFGLCFAFGSGVRYLPKRINNGSFDNFLTSPRTIYMRILASNSDTSAFGDILHGVVMLSVYVYLAHLSLLQVATLVTLIIPAVLILINFSLVSSLVGFLLPDAEAIARSIFELLLAPGMYPTTLYQGTIRFLFLFGIPALAIGGLPVEIVRDMSLPWYLIIWLLAILWTLIAVFLLNTLVKRYESGNLIGDRS